MFRDCLRIGNNIQCFTLTNTQKCESLIFYYSLPLVKSMAETCQQGEQLDTVEEKVKMELTDDSILSDIVSLSDGIITESMLKEEKILIKQTTEARKKTIEENNTKENDMSKEERYKQLQHLLGRSKFYTQYLQKKISDAGTTVPAVKKIRKEKTKQVQSPLKTRSAASAKYNGNANAEKQPRAKRSKKSDGSPYTLKKLKLELVRLDDVTVEDKAEAHPAETFYSKKEPNCDTDDEALLSLFTGGEMRPYQIEGYLWLKVLYENGVNGILGDEMGLGKTIQCIALIAHLIEHGVAGPYLICSPLSTLPNWISEFQRFTPKIPVILYHGSIEERTALRSKFRKLSSFDDFTAYPVVITSYEIIIKDHAALDHYKWKYIIVDEGHRIKNMNCLLIKHLKHLHSNNRLLLTGTPLQNNLSELWSLLNFILPELFDDLKIFESWFEVGSLSGEGSDERIIALEQEKQILATLHEILSPFLLRRVKADVELFIPPKRELMVYAPLTSKQQVLYKAIVDKTIHALLSKEDVTEQRHEELPMKRKPNLNSKPTYDVQKRMGASEINVRMLNSMMQLRKCCNHPYLLEYPIDPATQEYLVDQELVLTSGKILVLDTLVSRLIENGHKILIFSQMVKMLDVLHDFCYMKNYRFCRLDGSMNLASRQESIKEFNENPDVNIFLLSTRAGGLGLNLTAADTVIIYDSDWNPQCDLQAMDRCHRIGQTRPVVVYRLITENTIDQKIVERAAAKRKLEKMVIHKDKFKKAIYSEQAKRNGLATLSPAELLELLKSTDHDGVFSSNKKEVFTQQELDMLLDRTFTAKQQQSQAVGGRVKILENDS